MADKDLKSQLEDLLSGQEDPIRAIELAEPSPVADEKRQKAQSREEEQPTISLGTKSGGGRVVDEATNMGLGVYLTILGRRKWVIAVTLAVTVTVVVIGTLTMTPTYVASTTLRVATALGGSVSYTDYRYAEQLINTYAEIATSRPVLQELVQRLGLDQPPQIEVEIIANTELVHITVEDPNPILAREAANALAEILVAQSRELYSGGGKTAHEILGEQLAQTERELDQARTEHENLLTQSPEDVERIAAASRSISLKEQTYATLLQQYDQARVREAIRANALSVVEPAVAPEAPSKPRKALNIALGFMVGLAGGVGLAFLFENLDDTIKTPDDVSRALGLATLGAIGRLAKGEESLVVAAQPLSPVAEAFRALCTNVRFSSVDRPLRTLLVTSPGFTEGKSIAAANLAVAMTQAGLRVVAVDADLRRPRLGQLFGLDLGEGVTGERLWWGLSGSLLEGRTDGRLHPVQVEGLRVLPSGELPPNPAEIMGSQHMQKVLHELAGQADVVLIDSPPVLPVADATALAQAVDGVLLVLEAGHTRRQVARQAVESLRQVGANLVGVVLNRVPTRKSGYYYSSYHETYGNGSGRRKHRPRRRKGPLAAVRRLFGRRRKAD